MGLYYVPYPMNLKAGDPPLIRSLMDDGSTKRTFSSFLGFRADIALRPDTDIETEFIIPIQYGIRFPNRYHSN